MKRFAYHTFILTQLALSLSTLVLAQSFTDSLRLIYLEQKDTAKLETLRILTEDMVPDNDSLFKYSRIGIQESRLQKNTDYEGKFLMYLTIAAENASDYKSAIQYGKEAIALFDQNENRLWAAGTSSEIASIFLQLLQYDSAMFYLTQALDYHDKLAVNPGTLETLSNIARIHELTGNLDQSIDWTRKMLNLATANQLKYYESEAYFNLGKIYDLKMEYDSAIFYKHLALQETSDVKLNNYASVLGSLGNSFRLKGDLDSALIYNMESYKLSRDETRVLYRRDLRKSESAISLGALFFTMGKHSAARQYLKEGLELSSTYGFKDKMQEANLWLYKLAREEEKYEEALNFYVAYAELSRESINAENQRLIQQLTFQYDTKQKTQEILMLRLESELKDSKYLQIQNWLYISIIGIAMLLGIGFLLYNRMHYKQRALLSEERILSQRTRFKSVIEAEEKERKRIAGELHDSLGQLLSTVHLSLSSLDDRNERVQTSLHLMDQAISEVRSISHNMMPNALSRSGLGPALEDMIRSISKTGKIEGIYHSEAKIALDEETAVTVYRITQEIVSNALKHSKATELILTVKSLNGKIQITVLDNGQGFNTENIETHDGLGLRNIHSRVDLLGGELTIKSNAGEGTHVSLTIPINGHAHTSITG